MNHWPQERALADVRATASDLEGMRIGLTAPAFLWDCCKHLKLFVDRVALRSHNDAQLRRSRQEVRELLVKIGAIATVAIEALDNMTEEVADGGQETR